MKEKEEERKDRKRKGKRNNKERNRDRRKKWAVEERESALEELEITDWLLGQQWLPLIGC